MTRVATDRDFIAAMVHLCGTINRDYVQQTGSQTLISPFTEQIELDYSHGLFALLLLLLFLNLWDLEVGKKCQNLFP